jgi:hypothetical protein
LLFSKNAFVFFFPKENVSGKESKESSKSFRIFLSGHGIFKFNEVFDRYLLKLPFTR